VCSENPEGSAKSSWGMRWYDSLMATLNLPYILMKEVTLCQKQSRYLFNWQEACSILPLEYLVKRHLAHTKRRRVSLISANYAMYCYVCYCSLIVGVWLQIVRHVDGETKICACNETKRMHYLSSIYSVTIPLHVWGLLVAHHQEVTMYICN
jgi:hypothetical protein